MVRSVELHLGKIIKSNGSLTTIKLYQLGINIDLSTLSQLTAEA
jgi:hypothetical protein